MLFVREEPFAAVGSADERGWCLNAAGYAVAGSDDRDWVGSERPTEFLGG